VDLADPAARAAFFDVDGTLTTGTTLFRFLEYRLAADGHPPQAYLDERARLKAMTDAGAPRTETNRAYFSSYAGKDARRIADLAESWFRAEVESGGFFHPSSVAVLRRHQAAGEKIVLVSGSFPAPLAPVAKALAADAVLCTEPRIVSGRYTGEVSRTMIGTTKAETIRAWAERNRVSLALSTAYGDHLSDLPMLELAGDPCVIGTDPELVRRARREGWRRLPAAPEPPLLALP
jgi:HAD superfamily hydrolase (TIGR01490 family)